MFGVGLQKSGTNPKEEKTRRGEGWNHKESYCDSLKFDSRIHLHISLCCKGWPGFWPQLRDPGSYIQEVCVSKLDFQHQKLRKSAQRPKNAPKSLGPNGKFWNFDPFPPVITSLSRPWASVPKKKHMPRTLGSGLCCHQTWQSEIPELNRDYSRYYSHLWENHGGFSMAIFDERVLLMTKNWMRLAGEATKMCLLLKEHWHRKTPPWCVVHFGSSLCFRCPIAISQSELDIFWKVAGICVNLECVYI